MDKFFKFGRREHGNLQAIECAKGPLEIILSRLPTKTILMSKSVSKHWQSVISSPLFIRLQLHFSRENQKYIVFPHPEDYTYGVVRSLCLMEADGLISQRYVIPGLEELSTAHMVCTFNGLVCLTNDTSPSSFDLDIRICNPATREVFLLPRGSSSVNEPLIGVSFSTREHKYKIFKFFSEENKVKGNRDLLEIYSSNTGVWKRVGSVASPPMANRFCPYVPDHACVNETIYWFICAEDDDDTPGSILSIDMDEKLGIIELPDEVTPWSFLVELNGELCLICIDEDNFILGIWTYCDIGDSWSLRGSAEFDVGHNIVCFDTVAARGNEILFIVTDIFDWRHTLMYDLTLNTWKDFAFEMESPIIFPFSESLIQCGQVPKLLNNS